jgi:hypothetical protein
MQATPYKVAQAIANTSLQARGRIIEMLEIRFPLLHLCSVFSMPEIVQHGSVLYSVLFWDH